MDEKEKPMEETAFHYRKKPAFISFLLLYILCFGISYFLIDNSSIISEEIKRQVMRLFNTQLPAYLRNIPYGVIISVPFLIWGVRKLLWNVMSSYELTETEIRLITGSLSRKEQFYPVTDFFQISFRQNLIEAPFGAGTLILTRLKTGKRLAIRGVYRVKHVAEVLRSGLGVSF
ncbi:MAG: PH domain-containing protein [Nitrospiraceae bacterium]|nr:MAG: PH domain-containing protein [Nitrospiraceae bacterium]